MQTTYEELELNEGPVIGPLCGHLMALSSTDRVMGLSTYYELSECSDVMALKALPTMSAVKKIFDVPRFFTEHQSI